MVFIHGLGGDAFTTWRHGDDESTSWPHWLGEEFPEVGVWSLSYAASPSEWTQFLRLFSEEKRDSGHAMALPDRALQVLDLMVQRGLGERPLFFICHSLGGLVAKQILRKSSDATEARLKKVFAATRAVLFLATPHAGAGLASLADHFRSVFGPTAAIQDLKPHNPYLRDLFNWYRNHARPPRIETSTYYEERPVWGSKIVVDPTSAHPGIGADPVGLDEDHFSIAKPREKDFQVCVSARDLLRRVILAPPATDRAPDTRIPHELPPEAEKFFGRQTELGQLIERLMSNKNTAVVGPAGLGKTALAAKALREVVGETRSAHPNRPFPDGIVFLDLYIFHGDAGQAWNTLADKLSGSGFMSNSAADVRAKDACRGREILVVIEGGEEADGKDGRAGIVKLLSVLSPENRWLLLTRLSTQAAVAESVMLNEALHPGDAALLLDALTKHCLTGALRDSALKLLEGHPLALTWAGNLLARGDDDPARLLDDWEAEGLPKLSDPARAERTLEWLFKRSVRGLDGTASQVLAAAALLSPAPFPLAAIGAALQGPSGQVGRATLKSLVQSSLLRLTSKEKDHWQFAHVLAYRFARKETGSDPEIRMRMAKWLHGHLVAELATGTAARPLSLTRALEHLASLLRADDDQRLWQPLAKSALYEFSDRLNDIGRLNLVKLALGAVAGWLERFPAGKVQEPDWLRELSVLFIRQGDVLSAQGDLAGAQASYGKSLEVRRRLAEADPSNAGLQRDLSVSHDRIGSVLSAQGDLAGALESYKKMLEVSRRLAGADPSNLGWQRDLSVSHNKIADVLSGQGDLAGALESYKKMLEVSRRLAEADPSNLGWQRDLSVSHEKAGDVLTAQGDLAGAQEAYGESLEVRRRLAEADPSNAGWQRDLGASHDNIGDVLRAQGDLAGALESYGKSLEVSRRLAEADPSNAGWQRDLSVSHNKIGGVLSAQGDLAGTRAAYGKSLEVRRRLAEADPSNAGWQRDLSVSHEKMGDVLSAQGNLAGALESYGKSLEVSRRLAGADPSNAGWQRDLSVSHEKMGDVLSAQGNLAGALESYGKSLEVSRRLAGADPSNAGWQRDLSVSHVRMAQIHEKQGDRTAALRFAEESLLIGEHLAALDRGNAVWQRDVEVSRALVRRLRD